MKGTISMDQIKILAVVGFYMFAAILMVTVNKWVLLSFACPIFYVVCQLFIAVILLLLSHQLNILSLPKWDLKVVKGLWSTVLVNVLGFVFNTLCIQYVDASFYQVARGLILPMTIALSFAMNAAPPSQRCVLCCGFIILGFFIGVVFDKSVSIPSATLYGASGIVFGVLSSFTTAVNTIVIRQNLPLVNGSAIHLAWYSNLLTGIALLPLIPLTGEIGPIMEMVGNAEQLKTFAYGVALTGFVGFLISMAGLVSLKLTSPVTHMVSSALRGVIQTIISVQVFGDIIGPARFSSVACILLGSCAYIWVKHIESPPPSPKTNTSSEKMSIRDEEKMVHVPLLREHSRERAER